MTVKLIEEKALWDRIVDESPYGLLYHKWDFLKIAEKHTHCKFLPYGIYKNDELLSLFPLFYRKELMFKAFFSPPPQTCIPYLGPTMSPDILSVKESTRESRLVTVVDEMSAEIERLSPNYVYIQLSPLHNDIRPFKWNHYREGSSFTYFINIDRPLEEILKGFNRNARRLIKEAGEKSPVIKQVTDVDTFFDIQRKRFAEQGLSLPIVSPGYIKDLLAAYPDNLKMYFLYHENEIASAIIIYYYKGRMIYWIGNTRLNSGIAGNDYMLWEFIKKAKAEGCTEFEFQGADDRRLWHFKSKFNPRLEMSYSVRRTDQLGSIAEWAYHNLLQKKWV